MSRDIAISFEKVTKSYPSYHHVTGGIKRFLFNLGKSIGELKRRTLALQDISLEITKGECIGFIGRNGAGKSTLLGLIAGVLAPDAGCVQVYGRVSPLLELGAGFHAELTGRENILLNGVLMGLTQERVLTQVDAIIEFSELGDFIDQPVRTYSSGMYAKLGFSVVANLSPEILLVDEILSVGDLAFQDKCTARINQFRADDEVTIVLVSHSLDTVKQVCDRVAWIDGHQLKMIGPAADVVDAYIEAVSPRKIVAVTDYVEKLPPYVAVHLPYLDCSHGPSPVPLTLSYSPQGTGVCASLISQKPGAPIRQWFITGDLSSGASLILTYGGEGFDFVVKDDISDLKVGSGAVHGGWDVTNLDEQLFLELYTKGPFGDARHQRTLCPVFVSRERREGWERWRGRLFRDYGGNSELRAPLWPEGCTVRVVARNIFLRDAVGHFVLGVCGMLSQAGVPVRIYAYVSAPELAGVLQPITSLEGEIRLGDIVFYNYSIEDEFLGLVTSLNCKKVLYYHNVTPSEWFRPYHPVFAEVLDRSRLQFPEFGKFDAVLANSDFSLVETLPYLRDGVFRASCPPTLNPDRLHFAPEQAPPEIVGRVILWVGRMVPHKRPELAVQIFGELSKIIPDLSLVMVGSGLQDFPGFAEVFHGVVDDLPEATASKIIRYEGLADAELRALYERADLFLCTSAHEGYCVPLYEAMSFGLPVAAMSQGAVVETLAGAGLILDAQLDIAVGQLADLLVDQAAQSRLKCALLQRRKEIQVEARGQTIWMALTNL